MNIDVETKLNDAEVLTMHVSYVANLLKTFESYAYYSGDPVDVRKTDAIPAAVKALKEAMFSNDLYDGSELTFLDAVLQGSKGAVNVCADAVNFLEVSYQGEMRPRCSDSPNRVTEVEEICEITKQRIEGIYNGLMENGIHAILARECASGSAVIGGQLVFKKGTESISRASQALAAFLR